MAIVLKLLTLASFTAGIFAGIIPEQKLHPDAGLNVVEMIVKHGYPLERHEIQTEDGYLLEIQRIPHGINNSSERKGLPVLLLHGLTSSSTDWINAGVGRSLAYALADLGFDVWLGNNRGNMWGRKHITLDPNTDKKKFWDFSFHELGYYDVPAMIDHILEENGAEKLFYIGHSQGTTQFFAMAAARPEYNEKIILMNGLGPSAYMSHMPNPFVQLLAIFEEDLEFLSQLIGLYEFLPNTALGEIIGKAICDDEAPLQALCENIYFLICGYDSEQLNSTLLPVITTNLPAGTSTKEFLHYAQGVKSKLFRQYDYHSEEANIERYGQPTPPEYDVSKITAPVALHYGQNDLLVAVADAELLRDRLPNVVLANKIAFEAFNHGDFLWANDVFELLYNDVIELMMTYVP